jgi:hypothetical protein
MTNQILVPCAHAMNDGDPNGCLACDGSGHVRVVPNLDGKPVACLHASHDGKAAKCLACLGSGWAGFVDR